MFCQVFSFINFLLIKPMRETIWRWILWNWFDYRESSYPIEEIKSVVYPLICFSPNHFNNVLVPPSIDNATSCQLMICQSSPYVFLYFNRKCPKMAGRLWIFEFIMMPFAKLEISPRVKVWTILPCFHVLDLDPLPTVTDKRICGGRKMIRGLVSVLNK